MIAWILSQDVQNLEHELESVLGADPVLALLMMYIRASS